MATYTPTIISTPSGRFVLVGSGVPAELCYRRRDGAPLTDKDIENARHVGPGIAGLVNVTWDTAEEAMAACAAAGISASA